MTTVYSTRDVAAHERAAYWREVANRELARHEFCSGTGPAFRGTMRLDALGSLTISQFDCDPCHVRRSDADLMSCQKDDFVFTLQLAGKSVFSQDDREAVLGAGCMTLLDMKRPATVTQHIDTQSLAILMPRRELQSRLANVSDLSARVLLPGKPVADLVAGFVTLLTDRLDALADSGEKLSEQLLDLVALALSMEAGGEGGHTLSSPKAVALFRLKSAIEGHLSSAGLRPAIAAAEAGISVRYANLLLSQEGYSVERYIQHRRLERCRCALEDPKQASRTIGEIAFSWGFSDLSHFGRRFRAEYGYTPGDYRRRALAPDGS